ncbi:restriction endonuclease subunit S [Photobacterium sp. GB-50]|uniref:restriction endonuclease subunit S n=1 Tax=Photobacterium sp. GB-50 TaxID=2022107 RepID=UPI000D16EB25|nr:restriction endonuclease subunit S [Photobacterium sp. GB-50]PSW73709.1 restriction endonuclease subunit S [Photobacterium sp. GB-50]
MTVESLITQHIDTWTSAVKTKSTSGRGSSKKLELYGVKKLRELILELAVRGKLVPQDPNDEPASVLLERIAAEKVQLIKDKKISKQKKLPNITEDEKLEKLPEGWQLCRFGELYNLEYGDNLPKTKRSESGEYPVYGSNGIVGSHSEFSVNKGCVVVGRKGSAGALNKSITSCWVTDVAYSVTPPTGITLDYCFLHLSTFGLDTLGKGIKPGLNRNEANILIACIPPTEEQHRIVAKVDELMTLCDQLEQQTEASIEAHQLLVSTLLNTLTNSADADELMENWARISDHFDTLFTTEESIDQLKQTILQLAVMGKLVPQDPNDEPASVLLERIAEEKEQLIKEKKIKKQKVLPPIADNEKPFDLPNGWCFSRLESLSELITKGSSPKWQGVNYTENSEDVLFVTSENVGAFKLILDNEKYVEKSFNDIEPRSILKKYDFLMNIVGASIGRTALFDSNRVANINQAVCLIRLFPYQIIPEFFLIFFNSRTCISYMYDKQVDNARPNLSMGNISKFLIPIPPIREQKFIVDKVNNLMEICDQLKLRLKGSQITQLHLTDAIVEQAV